MKWRRVVEKDDHDRKGFAWLSDNDKFCITDAGPLDAPYELLHRTEGTWRPAGDPMETFQSLKDAKKEAQALLEDEPCPSK